jgi:hypothetical protein
MKILHWIAAALPLLSACDINSAGGQLMAQTETTSCQSDLGDVRPGNKFAMQRCDREAAQHVRNNVSRDGPMP